METERLLKEKETASGKTKEEAIMLLNHKEAIDFIIDPPDYLIPLSVPKIEDIHSLLIKELGVDKNIRKPACPDYSTGIQFLGGVSYSVGRILNDDISTNFIISESQIKRLTLFYG